MKQRKCEKKGERKSKDWEKNRQIFRIKGSERSKEGEERQRGNNRENNSKIEKQK